MQASQLRLFVIQTAAVDSDVATNESLCSKMHNAAVPMLARSRDAPLVMHGYESGRSRSGHIRVFDQRYEKRNILLNSSVKNTKLFAKKIRLTFSDG